MNKIVVELFMEYNAYNIYNIYIYIYIYIYLISNKNLYMTLA